VGEYDDTLLLTVNVYEHGEKNEELSPKAQMILNLSYFYHYIYSLDPETMMIQSVRFIDETMMQSKALALIDEKGQLTSILPEIFVADEKRYRDFIDEKTLSRRLEQSEYGMIRSVFRTKSFDDRFIWMTHMMLLAPNSQKKKILYVIRTSDDYKSMTDAATLVKNEIGSLFYEDESRSRYFEDLIHHSPIPFFWKDDHRRFVGVSQAFLDYYGFKSEKVVIGKTDEDMNWHPNNEGYKDIEEKVLKTGQTHKNVPGKCIAHGVTHNILATKWPIYKNGQISGLMGYFLDEADIIHDQKEKELNPVHATYKNVTQFIEDLIHFETDYRLNKRNFGVIYVRIPELMRIANNFGHEVMFAAVQECYQVIADVVDYKGTTAYFDVGQFAIAASYNSPQELVTMANQIREGIDAIRQIDDMPCSFYAKAKVFFTFEVMEAYHKITSSLFDENEYVHDEKDLIAEYNSVLETLMEEMPIGCYILRPDHTVQYWNREAEKMLGFSASEMQGKKCIDMPLGCTFTSGNHIPGHSCPATIAYATGRTHSMNMFMKHKDGKDVLIKNTLVPIKNTDGKTVELVSLFFPLTQGNYDEDLINRIYEVSTRDSLTCLPGRKYMEVCLQEAFELYHRAKRPFAVLFADVNNFHDINNTYGHGSGDEILRQFGLALRKYGRKTDRFCRWGGDEFVGLLQLKDSSEIEEASNRFLKIADACYNVINGDKIYCKAAIGITVVREDDTIESLVARADSYMYRAKKSTTEKIVSDYTKSDE
jgi:diguanylate cyclase (GGDEF)-like protein/PAS domain S-box-containing protein